MVFTTFFIGIDAGNIQVFVSARFNYNCNFEYYDIFLNERKL